MKRTVGQHEARVLATVRGYFVECRGEVEAAQRASEIAALPAVKWKGHTLRTVRCHGTRGKGPHDCHLPESVLWNLMGLTGYRCVYHAGD